MVNEAEQRRLDNIKKNQELLESLGIPTKGSRLLRSPTPPDDEKPSAARPNKRKAAPAKKRSERQTEWRSPRKSGRIARRADYREIAADGAPTQSPERERGAEAVVRRSRRVGQTSGGKYEESDDEHGAGTRDGAYVPEQRQALRKIPNPSAPRRQRRRRAGSTSSSASGSEESEADTSSAVDFTYVALPSRESASHADGGGGTLLFEPANAHFTPNVTPEEMIRSGIFGGTMFKPHYSRPCRRQLDPDAEIAELPREWFEGVHADTYRSATYEVERNRYGVKAGQTLEDWEASQWIEPSDPRGWWQWYFRFYLGRRGPDDARQIARWLKACGPAGRFKRSLAKRVYDAGTTWDDESVSPVVRQTLLHWAYQLTKRDYEAYLP